MIAAGQQRLAGGRAERSSVEAIELQSGLRQPLGIRRMGRPAERTGCAKPDIVDENDQHIGRALGWTQWLDRRVFRGRIGRVIRGHTHVLRIGNRKNRALNRVSITHLITPLESLQYPSLISSFDDPRYRTPSSRLTY
jgi:hypothetical protein